MAPITKTTTYYRVSNSDFNSWFCQSGYSKYYERLTLSHEGKLANGEQVYGYEQALDHIKEIKLHEYEGKLINKDTQFKVKITTEVDTIITL